MTSVIKHAGVCISGCLYSILVTAAPNFDIGEFDTGNAVEQTVMTANLTSENKADIIVINVSKKFEKVLKLYKLENNSYSQVSRLEVPIGKDVISTDVGRFQQRDIVVMFTDHEAIWYDLPTGTTKTLIHYQSIFNTPIRDSIQNLNLFRDVNNDGLDDFYIPGFKGPTVYIQKKDGSFSDGIAMFAPPVMTMSPGSASYRVIQDYLADMNLDGLQDIAFYFDGQFTYYAGRPDGLFEGTAVKFGTNVPFQYASQSDMDREMNGRQEHSNFKGKALYRLKDLDNDDITDLVVLSVSSKGVLDKNMVFEIYKGRRDITGGLVFSDAPISKILSNGQSFGLIEKDFNNDKKADFLVPSVDIGVGKIIKGLISRSADIELNFYQMKDGKYPERPNVSRKLKVRFNLSSGRVFFPAILSGDLDGDGLEELIVQKGADTLQVFTGTGDEELFEKNSTDITVDLPVGENGSGNPINPPINLVELNGDGKPDFFIRHNSKTGQNRIVVMLSK